MKRTSPFFVAALLVMTISTAEAYHPAETFTDQNGDKRHVKIGKVYRKNTSIRDFKMKNAKPNEGKIFDIVQKKPLKDEGNVNPSNMQWIQAEELPINIERE